MILAMPIAPMALHNGNEQGVVTAFTLSGGQCARHSVVISFP